MRAGRIGCVMIGFGPAISRMNRMVSRVPQTPKHARTIAAPWRVVLMLPEYWSTSPRRARTADLLGAQARIGQSGAHRAANEVRLFRVFAVRRSRVVVVLLRPTSA